MRNRVRCDCASFPAKLRNHVVGERGNFGVRISLAKGRHKDLMVADRIVSTLQYRPYHVRAAGVVHAARPSQRRVIVLSPISVPLMAARASTRKEPTAE